MLLTVPRLSNFENLNWPVFLESLFPVSGFLLETVLISWYVSPLQNAHKQTASGPRLDSLLFLQPPGGSLVFTFYLSFGPTS